MFVVVLARDGLSAQIVEALSATSLEVDAGEPGDNLNNDAALLVVDAQLANQVVARRPVFLVADETAEHWPEVSAQLVDVVALPLAADFGARVEARVRQIAAVTEARNARARAMRLVIHDLNNPLTAMRMLSEMLRDDATDPQTRTDLNDIIEAADVFGALLESTAALLRLDSEPRDLTWAALDLVPVFEVLCARPALNKHVVVDLPPNLHVIGDMTSVSQAVLDVLLNARRLTEGRGRVWVRGSKHGKRVELTVTQSAVAVPPELHGPLLTAYGAPTVRNARIPVSAFGLAHARYVVETLGGTLTLEPPDGHPGLTIRISLPSP